MVKYQRKTLQQNAIEIENIVIKKMKTEREHKS